MTGQWGDLAIENMSYDDLESDGSSWYSDIRLLSGSK
jgi:hypothetical protein